MDTMETICKRRSIRSYTGENIAPEELKKILKAANAAPVGMGQYEKMHLTVIQDPQLLEKIDKACAAMMGMPDVHALYGAPLLVLVSFQAGEKPVDNVGASNAAIVVHNMVLEATELGIGACYIWGAIAALNASPALVEELGLPQGFVPCCGVTLGKTGEVYEMRDIPEDRIKTAFLG